MLKDSCRIQDVDPNPPVESGWELLPLGETPGGQSDTANTANKSLHRWVKATLVRNGRVSQTREGKGRGPAGEYKPAWPAGPITSPKARITSAMVYEITSWNGCGKNRITGGKSN